MEAEASMIFIDTGAFVARYRKSDDAHRAARVGFKEIGKRRTRCYTSLFVIAEASRLLRPYLGAKRIAGLVGTWLESELMAVLRTTADDELQAVEVMHKYADHEL